VQCCYYVKEAAYVEAGCQTKRTLKLGVATQCDFASVNVKPVQRVDTGAATWASPEEVFELFRRKRGELGVECEQSTSDLMDAQLLESLKGMSAIELRRCQTDISAQLA
jgi:hypothetical protein